MRLFAALAALAVSACAEPEGEVATQTQAAEVAPTGRQDVPEPGSEPLPPESDGPPVTPPPLDPHLLEKQRRYRARVEALLPAWIAARLSEPEIEARRAALKREILGDAP